MAFLLFLAAISCLAGFLGGLTGSGGIIMPPLLIWLHGVDPHLAMAMAQASYIVPSALAVVMFVRKSQFEWRVAFPIAFSGFLFSFLSAAYLKPRLNGTVLTILFAGCIILAGATMFRRGGGSPGAKAIRRRTPALAALGAAVGLLAGVTGSGANAILVPVMVFMGIDILAVLAACQFFSVLVASAGTAGNALNLHLDPVHIASLVAGQLVGMWLGVRLAQRLDTGRLKLCVGAVCVLTGLFMLYRVLA